MFRRHCLALLVAALATGVSVPLRAGQAPVIESVFRSGVEIVRTRLVQTGRRRAPKRLVKADFEVKQNGVVQAIDVFEVFVLSPTRVCYEVAFASTTPASAVNRTVEIKIRGYVKPIKNTYTLGEHGSQPERLGTEASCNAGG